MRFQTQFSEAAWAENFWCIFRVKTLFSNIRGVVWMGPKMLHQKSCISNFTSKWLLHRHTVYCLDNVYKTTFDAQSTNTIKMSVISWQSQTFYPREISDFVSQDYQLNHCLTLNYVRLENHYLELSGIILNSNSQDLPITLLFNWKLRKLRNPYFKSWMRWNYFI